MSPDRRPARRLELMGLEELHPADRNPKRHDAAGIAASMAHHGVVELITIDERTGRIVAGHGRLESLTAAHAADPAHPPEGVEVDDAGAWRIPVVRGWASRSDADAEAYLVYSNRSTELGGWDRDQLVAMLGDAGAAGTLALTGYTGADVDQLVADAAHAARNASRNDPDKIPPPPPDAVTATGDLWTIGPHRLICGDARDPDVLARLMGGAAADFVITSPPYNVGVDYGEHDDRPTPWVDYRKFLQAVLDTVLPHLRAGRAIAWNIGTSPNTHHARQQVLLEDLGLTYVRTLVWQKVGVPVPLWHFTESDPRARQFTPNYTHELVLIYARGSAPTGDPDPERALAAWPAPKPLTPEERHELVVVYAKGKNLKKGKPVAIADLLANDVFSLAQSQATVDLPAGNHAGTVSGAQSHLTLRSVKAHPAAYPVALPEAFITHLADVGEVVLDPFAGAASTIVAAWRTGRRGYGVELSPGYVDVALRRLQEHTGLVPILDGYGPVTFTDGA